MEETNPHLASPYDGGDEDSDVRASAVDITFASANQILTRRHDEHDERSGCADSHRARRAARVITSNYRLCGCPLGGCPGVGRNGLAARGIGGIGAPTFGNAGLVGDAEPVVGSNRSEVRI
jgi:hypothetical protein